MVMPPVANEPAPPIAPVEQVAPAQPATPPAQIVPEPSAPNPEAWMDWLDPELRESNTLKPLSGHQDHKKAMNEMAKQLVNSQKLIGEKSPGPNAPDEEVLNYRKAQGEVTVDSLKAPEIKNESGEVVALPEELDAIVKDVLVKRNLGQNDYEAIYRELADITASAPETCKQTLISQYGEQGAQRVELSCKRVCDLMGEEGQALMQATQTDPEIAASVAKLSTMFGESTIPKETVQSQTIAAGESVQQQAQIKFGEYQSAYQKSPNSPETQKLYNEWLAINQKAYEQNNKK